MVQPSESDESYGFLYGAVQMWGVLYWRCCYQGGLKGVGGFGLAAAIFEACPGS
jgi:hypothetical protein